jgi:death on curing protein
VTRYIGLAEYIWLAEQVTGIDTTTLVKASRVELADSALHAPAAGFGDDDFYPDIYDKAAVLWPGTTHFLTATNAPPGRRCSCSST